MAISGPLRPAASCSFVNSRSAFGRFTPGITKPFRSACLEWLRPSKERMTMGNFAGHKRQFQKHLKKLKVSAYWVNFVPDLFYLAGYASEGCWGVIGPDYAYMLVPGLALDQATSIAKGFKVHSLKKASDAYARVVDLALKHRATTIGYDPYRTQEALI